MSQPLVERQHHIERHFEQVYVTILGSLHSAVSFLVPHMLSYGSAGVPAVPATISMSDKVITSSCIVYILDRYLNSLVVHFCKESYQYSS